MQTFKRSIEQNREHRNKLTHYPLIYDKGGKNIQWRKNKSFQQAVLETLNSYM